ESVHQLLTDQIRLMKLGDFYHIQQKNIVGINGTEFFFAGVRQSVDNLKSYEGVHLAWGSQAEAMSKRSLNVVFPHCAATSWCATRSTVQSCGLILIQNLRMTKFTSYLPWQPTVLKMRKSVLSTGTTIRFSPRCYARNVKIYFAAILTSASISMAAHADRQSKAQSTKKSFS